MGSFWRLVRAKLVPKPSSNHLLVKKVVVHETIYFFNVFYVFSPGMAPPNDPRWLQDSFEIVLIASFCLFRVRVVLGVFSASFWLRFGCPKWTPGGTQGVRNDVQRGPNPDKLRKTIVVKKLIFEKKRGWPQGANKKKKGVTPILEGRARRHFGDPGAPRG